jgi:hypothetical protein
VRSRSTQRDRILLQVPKISSRTLKATSRPSRRPEGGSLLPPPPDSSWTADASGYRWRLAERARLWRRPGAEGA